jgi:hypothetical protein
VCYMLSLYYSRCIIITYKDIFVIELLLIDRQNEVSIRFIFHQYGKILSFNFKIWAHWAQKNPICNQL